MARRGIRKMGDFVPYLGRNWVIGGREPRSYELAKTEREILWASRKSDADLRWKVYYIWCDTSGQRLTRPLLNKFFARPELPQLVGLLRKRGESHLRRAARAAFEPREKRLLLVRWLDAARSSPQGGTRG
jgi:hypothetical protein